MSDCSCRAATEPSTMTVSDPDDRRRSHICADRLRSVSSSQPCRRTLCSDCRPRPSAVVLPLPHSSNRSVWRLPDVRTSLVRGTGVVGVEAVNGAAGTASMAALLSLELAVPTPSDLRLLQELRGQPEEWSPRPPVVRRYRPMPVETMPVAEMGAREAGPPARPLCTHSNLAMWWRDLVRGQRGRAVGACVGVLPRLRARPPDTRVRRPRALSCMGRGLCWTSR